MSCRDDVSPKLLLRNCKINSLRMKRLEDNHTTKTCAFFMYLLSFCRVINDCSRKIQKVSLLSSNKWIDTTPTKSKDSTSTIVLLLRIRLYSRFCQLVKIMLMEHYRRLCQTKFAETGYYCASTEIQQSHMLCEQHQRCLPRFLISQFWNIFQQNI